mgnify:CR=1 FL=1
MTRLTALTLPLIALALAPTAARADVVLENYRPGVMERLGYGWEALHTRHPRLIYGAVSGFGHTGPDSGKPAYDMVVQARGGVMSITGEEGGPPVRVGASLGDIVAGMYLAQGVLAALYDRSRTGLGGVDRRFGDFLR